MNSELTPIPPYPLNTNSDGEIPVEWEVVDNISAEKIKNIKLLINDILESEQNQVNTIGSIDIDIYFNNLHISIKKNPSKIDLITTTSKNIFNIITNFGLKYPLTSLFILKFL